MRDIDAITTGLNLIFFLNLETILLSLSSRLPFEMLEVCSSCSSAPSSNGVPPVAIVKTRNLPKQANLTLRDT